MLFLPMEPITATNSSGYGAPVGITVDAVVFTLLHGKLSVLLARRAEGPHEGDWALPGGFQGATETPEQSVVRKLEEKTGMPPVYFEQLRFYGDPERDPRGWLPSVAYLSLVPCELLPEQTDTDAAWHPVDELPELPFDHLQMVADGLDRLRGKLRYSNVAMGLLPERFTARQARQVYEAILGTRLPAANFTRDLLRTGLVRATGERRADGPGRPSEVLEFVSRSFSWSPASRRVASR